MAPLESWTRSNNNFFNNSFVNKEKIIAHDLGYGLDPESRRDLRRKH
jgi:hypothetical protein